MGVIIIFKQTVRKQQTKQLIDGTLTLTGEKELLNENDPP